MSDTKFTSGEWSQSHRQGKDEMYRTQVYDSRGETICTLHWHTEPDSTATDRPENAHLIASAPDMYRMLEACEKTFAALYPSEVKHVQSDHYSEFKAVHHLIGSIQNSLSKARGE